MNFLEQLVSEWYAYRGHFVRTNIKFGKRAKGGWKGEMDVVAYHPTTSILTHVEASTDASPWGKRKVDINRKFKDANAHYEELFNFEIREIKRLAIISYFRPRTPVDFGNGIELLIIPQFVERITEDLSKRSPLRDAVPEEYPLLRAMQLSAYYGVSRKPGIAAIKT